MILFGDIQSFIKIYENSDYISNDHIFRFF